MTVKIKPDSARMVSGGGIHIPQVNSTRKWINSNFKVHIDGLARDGKLHLQGPDGSPVTAPVRSAWRCNHWRPLLGALLAGNGIGVLQTPVCRSELETGRLVAVLADHRLPDLPVHAIYPGPRRMPAKTSAVLAWLQAQLPALLDEEGGTETETA